MKVMFIKFFFLAIIVGLSFSACINKKCLEDLVQAKSMPKDTSLMYFWSYLYPDGTIHENEGIAFTPDGHVKIAPYKHIKKSTGGAWYIPDTNKQIYIKISCENSNRTNKQEHSYRIVKDTLYLDQSRYLRKIKYTDIPF
jgi:hypothetical protein